MPTGICDVCGEEKDVYGGKVCFNGHFVCKGEMVPFTQMVLTDALYVGSL